MPHDHPGFEYWRPSQPGFPFPVGDIDLNYANPDSASASAEFTLPAAQPTPATVAERFIGIAHSAKLWWGIECINDLQGGVICAAVLRGQHVHWFAEHGESESGPIQEIRLTAADMNAGGYRQVVAPHGPHCDTFSVTWSVQQGKVHCTLLVIHFRMTVEQFRRARDEAKRHSEKRIIVEPPPLLPEPDEPEPTPAPVPMPGA